MRMKNKLKKVLRSYLTKNYFQDTVIARSSYLL